MIGLAGLCGMAAMVAYGTLVAIDNAVTAEAVQARLEAAALIQANLPPAIADADNAAPLHRHAKALLAGDDSLKTWYFSLHPDDALDIQSPEVAELLARHADTLDLIRRAADKNACRFDRDWSRASIFTWLREIDGMQEEAGLLALAARRAAADGDAAPALVDTVRIHRIARQAAAEPIIDSHLVSLSLDRLAHDTLGRVLPSLEPDDLALLDTPGLDDVVSPPPPLLKYMLGEEALGVSVLADIATGREQCSAWAAGIGETITGVIIDHFDLFGLLYRTLFLRGDSAAYRAVMHQYQQICANDDVSSSALRQVRYTNATIDSRGWPCTFLETRFGAVLGSQLRATARARAAQVLIAATKRRLTGGGFPESLSDLVPDRLSAVPRDPYTDNKQPVRSKPVDGGMLVWSVGPDGENDGGPTGRDTSSDDTETGNDDFGVWLMPDRPHATPVD